MRYRLWERLVPRDGTYTHLKRLGTYFASEVHYWRRMDAGTQWSPHNERLGDENNDCYTKKLSLNQRIKVVRRQTMRADS